MDIVFIAKRKSIRDGGKLSLGWFPPEKEMIKFE